MPITALSGFKRLQVGPAAASCSCVQPSGCRRGDLHLGQRIDLVVEHEHDRVDVVADGVQPVIAADAEAIAVAHDHDDGRAPVGPGARRWRLAARVHGCRETRRSSGSAASGWNSRCRRPHTTFSGSRLFLRRTRWREASTPWSPQPLHQRGHLRFVVGQACASRTRRSLPGVHSSTCVGYHRLCSLGCGVGWMPMGSMPCDPRTARFRRRSPPA